MFLTKRCVRCKKNQIKPWLQDEWCIPKEANAEFVCDMEDVLEVYKKPMVQTHPALVYGLLSQTTNKGDMST
ncbi:MAG: hypothetical protein VSS75_033055 [Candidatus Parabeggiatoa sp.]|nr:hypothetical protein [Candidatus Parabeggiatoa sp.]